MPTLLVVSVALDRCLTILDMHIEPLVFVSCLMSALVTNAHAWGTQVHQVIAAVAAAQLSTKARAEVEQLLALEPGETLASICL